MSSLSLRLKGPDGLPISSSRNGSKPQDSDLKDPPMKLNTTLKVNGSHQSTDPSERNFWQSNFGLEAQSKLYASDDEETSWGRSNGVTFTIDESDERRAAGSAIHAARFVGRNS